MHIGRPKKYDDEKVFEDKVSEYFVKENYPWTVTGLCLHLGIVRETLCDYEKKPIFSDTIKSAKQAIENYAENMLFSKEANAAGIIFNLKNNFKWKDKQEIEANIITNKKIEDLL